MEQQHAVSYSTTLIEAQHVSDYNLSPAPAIRSVDVRAPEGNSKYVYGYQTIDDRASSSRSYLTSATFTSPTLSRLDLFKYSLEGNRRNSYSVQAPAPSVAKCASDWTTCPGATAFNYEHDGRAGSNWDSSKTNRVIDDTNHTYQYDADGNMRVRTDKTTGNRTIYAYNVDNQLTHAETWTPANVKIMESNYRYDALGRRIAKTVGRPGSGLPAYIRKYVYLGDNPLAAYDETNNLVTRYEYTGAVDDILMAKHDLNRDGNLTLDGDNEFFYYKDLFGNVTHIIGKNHNNKVKQYKYSPYGQLFSEWTSPGIHTNFENNILFTAREWDAELNLYYLRARHYDPDTGKFLQEDPVFDLNAYMYGNNNPVLFSDPFGENAAIVVGGVAIVVGTGTAIYLRWKKKNDNRPEVKLVDLFISRSSKYLKPVGTVTKVIQVFKSADVPEHKEQAKKFLVGIYDGLSRNDEETLWITIRDIYVYTGATLYDSVTYKSNTQANELITKWNTFDEDKKKRTLEAFRNAINDEFGEGTID